MTTATAEAGVRLGARKVLQIHGASPEELQIVFKAEAGSTPRTVADLKSGEAIKRFIARKFPQSTVNEEETGVTEGIGYTWHVDPLDGTSSYAREQRYSTVGIAVYESGAPVSAAICQPFERELLIAEKGKGAYVFSLDKDMIPQGGPRRLEVSKAPLEGGIAYVDALFNNKTSGPKLALIDKLVKLSNGNLGIRSTGSNIDQQRQVASGRAEVTITDAVGGFFDLAAGGLIIEEAGGKFTDIYGKPVGEQTQVAIGSNGKEHEAILRIAAECYQGYTGFK